MGLNYELGDKSENLIRMNHFEKFKKAIRNFFFWQKMLDARVLCVYFGAKDWRQSNIYGTLCIEIGKTQIVSKTKFLNKK